MTKFLQLLLAVSLCMSFGACQKSDTTPEDVEEEMTEAVKTTKEYLYGQRAEYQKKVAAELDEMKKQAAKMRADLEKAGEQAAEGAREALDDLEKGLKAVDEKSKEIANVAEEGWEDLRDEIEQMVGEIRETLKE